MDVLNLNSMINHCLQNPILSGDVVSGSITQGVL